MSDPDDLPERAAALGMSLDRVRVLLGITSPPDAKKRRVSSNSSWSAEKRREYMRAYYLRKKKAK
jgi:hypothetical protein